MNIAEYVALTRRVPVLFFSLEMGAEELGERFLSAHARINSYHLRHPGLMPEAENAALDAAEVALVAAPLWIDDASTRTVARIASDARRQKRHDGLGLLVVDYLQLIEPAEGRNASRQEQVAGISRGLKKLAKDLDVPVLALCQLNRLAERREDRRPMLADLRDSGEIEQDAHAVILLHRPDYYDPDDRPGIVEAIVAKNRSGESSTPLLVFRKECTRFESYSARPEPSPDFGPAPAF